MGRLVFLFSVLIFLVSCGVDPFKKEGPLTANQFAAGCSLNHDPMPVCGSDGNDYENISFAKCKGLTQWTQGHCQCQPNLIVCGEDGLNHNECEAIQLSVKIVKFMSCNQTPL